MQIIVWRGNWDFDKVDCVELSGIESYWDSLLLGVDSNASIGCAILKALEDYGKQLPHLN